MSESRWVATAHLNEFFRARQEFKNANKAMSSYGRTMKLYSQLIQGGITGLKADLETLRNELARI